MKRRHTKKPISKKLQHLLRTEGNRSDRPIILIVCEGQATEPQYFQGIINERRLANVTVRAAAGSDPKSVVADAKASKKQRDRESQTSVAIAPYDEVWCVFDVDQHPNIKQAINNAQLNDILIAISNPCFEFWLILHFVRFATTNQSREQIKRQLCSHINGYKKGGAYNKILLPKLNNAIEHAAHIWKTQWQINDPTAMNALEKNPSTLVHRLVKSLLPK